MEEIDHDVEYANNLMDGIEAEHSVDKDLKLSALDKWFETKLAPLSTLKKGSFCCERYLKLASPETLINLAECIEGNMESMVAGNFSSFVIKAIFIHLLKSLQKKKIDRDLAKKIKTWILTFCEFCSDNLKDMISNDCSIFVLKTFLQLLSGIDVSFNFRNNKRKRDEAEVDVKSIKIHKEFSKPSLDLTKKLFEEVNLEEWLANPHMATLLSIMLEVLHSKEDEEFAPKCKSLHQVYDISDPTKDLLSSTQGSFLAEKIWVLSSEEHQQYIYNTYLKSKLVDFGKKERVKRFVQNLLTNTKCSKLFKKICKELCTQEIFADLVTSKNLIILIGLAEGCIKHVKSQKIFLNVLKDYLHCQEKPLLLFPTILHLLTVEDYKNEDIPKEITLPGSRIIQSILKFEKNTQIIDSFLALKVDNWVKAANHSAGSYVIEAILKNETIDKSSLKSIYTRLMPHISTLAEDKFGSRVFDLLWENCDSTAKEQIASNLVENEERLSKRPSFKFIVKKCNLNQFKYNKNKWSIGLK